MNLSYSLVIPVYKNESNIPDLLEAVDQLQVKWSGLEVIYVVDGSPDRSWELLRNGLSCRPAASQLILLSRNFGSFAAIRAGLEAARGRYIAVMAADLQEPPELISKFWEALASEECDVVIGQRSQRSDSLFSKLCSALYWKFYRHFIISDIPPGGVDVFACTSKVAKDILNIQEANSSLVGQIFWVGYRRKSIPYIRRARERGHSAWTLKKRFTYFLNSIFSFSDLPLMALLWLGAICLVFSVFVGSVTFLGKLMGLNNVSGYTTLVLLNIIFFSALIFSQGIIGCYLWRCFENTKQRPLTLIRKAELFGEAPEQTAPGFDKARE